jgi:hypothetical protein
MAKLALVVFTGQCMLPEGHKLLNPVVVFTQKLHADFTYERGKARVCVGDSRGKPGEYADVCAHVAQLSTYKYQRSLCAWSSRASCTAVTGLKLTSAL